MKSQLQHLLASLTLFTRLPWWRISNLPSEAFKYAVDYWPWAGFLTGGIMALIFFLCIQFTAITLPVAIMIIMVVRLLLTGALHEDGFADFCDGMGGGVTRERKLEIMKDSHIGTYGVIGLIIYFLFLYSTLHELAMHYAQTSLVRNMGQNNPILMMCATIWLADIWGKSVASFITLMPYARSEEGAKVKAVYHTPSFENILMHLIRIVLALALPFILMIKAGSAPSVIALLSSIVLFLFLARWMRKSLGGYTGDCCGASFLLCELCFLLFQLAMY